MRNATLAGALPSQVETKRRQGMLGHSLLAGKKQTSIIAVFMFVFAWSSLNSSLRLVVFVFDIDGYRCLSDSPYDMPSKNTSGITAHRDREQMSFE